MDNIIYSSAVLALSQTTQFARNKSIDTTIIHLVASKGLSEFTVEMIYNTIREEFPIRLEEIANSIQRSVKNENIQIVKGDKNRLDSAVFKISEELDKKVVKQSEQISSFLNDSIEELFEGIVTAENKVIIESMLMNTLARLMAEYGYAYASQLAGGDSASEFVPLVRLKEICKKVIGSKEIGLTPEHLAESIGILFDRRDPCLNNLAFSICNRYYTSRLMGLDLPVDFLSDNIYKDSTIFLDTNFILSIAFSKSERHNEFKEILKRANKLGITFSVSELTVAEIHARVSQYKDLLEKSEELIPDELIEEVQDSIVHTQYKTNGTAKLDINTSNHAEKLKNMGVEILQFNAEEIEDIKSEFDVISEELRTYDRKYRSSVTRKDEAAIFHDTYLYFLINNIRKKNNTNSAWFLTRDNSVINHAQSKIVVGESPYSIKLLTLLQTLSPFVESQALKGEFADLFADLISKDLLPKEQHLSIEDLKMLVGFDVRAKAIPPEFIRKATAHIKKNILHGGGVTEENKHLVIQEFAKYVSTPELHFVEYQKKYEKKLRDREDEIKEKDKKIEQIESKNSAEILRLEKDLEILRQENTSLKQESIKKRNIVVNVITWAGCFILSYLIWFNSSTIYNDVLSKFRSPFFLKVSFQLSLLYIGLLISFSTQRKIISIISLLSILATFFISLARL